LDFLDSPAIYYGFIFSINIKLLWSFREGTICSERKFAFTTT